MFRLGHFEHGDSDCDSKLKEFPPKGLYIESLFKNPDSFPKLKKLYLEQECSLTYWLDIRIQRVRPNIEIKYTRQPQLLENI